MTLASGTRLGPYEILAPLGAGGMGEVYKALDTRLGRTVAIKVLPAAAASDPDRRRRFEQEARAVSALNHPHICVLYDIGRDGDTDFLVMELLGGQTLAHRLRKGPLPLDQALDLGAQIADALAAAHKHGIVHRDLKPANVMLVKAGAGLQAKLLDFGLAKLKAESAAFAHAADGLSALPTEGPATSPGVVMGTAPYMAPEQFEGREADARTDLFAFGCVLYEMLTGRRAFAGESEASVISAIMTGEPAAPSALSPRTPTPVDRLVLRCLAKDPDRRWQDATDVAEELRAIGCEPSADVPGPSVSPKPVWMKRVLMSSVAVVAFAAAALAWLWGIPASGPLSPARYQVEMPGATVLSCRSATCLALAPDGSGAVYPGRDGSGRELLYWHNLDESAGWALAGTEDSAGSNPNPFFSPDGRWLGFVRQDRVLKIPLHSGRVPDGGYATEIARTGGSVRGAAWADDGTILLGISGSGLWRMSEKGGELRPLTRADHAKGESDHRWPSMLPGGRAALFTVYHASGRSDRCSIGVVSLDTADWKPVQHGGGYARYLPSGHLLYARNGALLAVRFDLQRLEAKGDPVAIMNGVFMASRAGNAVFDVSSDGWLVFAPFAPGPREDALVWVDRMGRVEQAAPEKQPYGGSPALAPDGQHLAVVRPSADYSDLWVYHLHERRWQQLTKGSDSPFAVWAPDSDTLAFNSNRDGALNLYAVRVHDESPVERLTRSPNWQHPFSWSPDGRFLAFTEHDWEGAANANHNTWILPLGGDRRPWLWGVRGTQTTQPAFSPDGRWLAYQSRESGRMEVYVRPFPGPGPRQLVSGTDGGFAPVWTPDGRELLYMVRPGDSRLLSSRIKARSTWRAAEPRVAFSLPFNLMFEVDVFSRQIAVTPDGNRILTVQLDERDSSADRSLRVPNAVRTLTVIPNWRAMVKAQLPK